MKTYIYTLSAMVLATSLSFAKEKPGGPGKPDHPKPEEVFAKLDTDGNGSVILEEFKNGPRSQKNPAKAEEVFKKIDINADGNITLEEFKAHRPPHGPGKGGPGKGGDGAPPPPAE